MSRGNLKFFPISLIIFPVWVHNIPGDNMKLWKDSVIFYLGGMAYMGLELLWRGWTHGSMFLLGGLCFWLIGNMDRMFPRMPLVMQAVAGGLTVSALELIFGLYLNVYLGLEVWDYSSQPFSLWGQVCPGYFFLWVLVSFGAVFLEDGLRHSLFGDPMPAYRVV